MSCSLHAAGLEYRYPNGREALRGVDLHLRHGERVALLGPNGAGKTTFMLHLNGLLRGEGHLEVAGVVVGDKTLQEVRARVGLVFQDPDDQLFMPTVREHPRLSGPNATSSRTVGMNSWSSGSWNTSPTRARRSRTSSCPTRRPATSSLPAPVLSPLRWSMNVVLPAPLGPSSATRSPWRRCRSMPRSASRPFG